jgi:Cof subfamily protein (haloacid dehalogenase superfamily)
MPIRMIAIDIDGTLLPTRGAAISARNCRTLREAEAAGIAIVIATGRRQSYAAPLIEPVRLTPETVFITSNGTVTRTLGGRSIDRFLLPVETARELCPVLRQFGGTMVFTFDRTGRRELVIESLERLRATIAPWVEANRASIEEINPLERAFDDGEAPVQGMVCGTVAEMREAEAALEGYDGRIEMHRTEYAGRDLSILDILPAGCSKGVALARLAEGLGIARDEVMAIGDNFNDLEMLRFAGHPVVMANGASELVRMAREAGWRVGKGNDEDGVAEAIEGVLDAMKESVGIR